MGKRTISSAIVLIAIFLGNLAPVKAAADEIGYWKFDEASGNASDSSGNGRTFTNNGTTPYVTGKINNGADLESGSTQYFSSAHDPAFVPSEYTISAWVKLESNDGLRTIFSKEASGVGYLLYNNGGGLYLTHQGVGSIDGGSLPTGSFIHVVATWNGTTAKLYVNNSETASGTLASLNSTTAEQTIGNRSSGVSAGLWDGIIDEVGIWNRALTTDEINTLYNGGTGHAYPFDFEDDPPPAAGEEPSITCTTIDTTMTCVDNRGDIPLLLAMILFTNSLVAIGFIWNTVIGNQKKT